MQRKWVICAFLDIRGFRLWTYRAAIASEIKEEFIEEFYRVLQCFVCKQIKTWTKYEGDGIIIIKEFESFERKNRRLITEFISDLRTLLRKVKSVIRESEAPPDGARIRITDGYVDKIMVLDPNDPKRRRKVPEYIEYCINTARGLLEVNPEISCLVTKDIIDLMKNGKSKFKIKALAKPSCYPRAVNKEDIEGLHIIRF